METFEVGDIVKLTGNGWGFGRFSRFKRGELVQVQNTLGPAGWAIFGGFFGVDPDPNGTYGGEVYARKTNLTYPANDKGANQNFDAQVSDVLDDVESLLTRKNKAYGNSALEPVRVFSTADPVEQLRVRIDDKLSRLKSSLNNDNEDTVLDLMGYLVLLRIATRKQDTE